jgi:hypothetical protein
MHAFHYNSILGCTRLCNPLEFGDAYRQVWMDGFSEAMMLGTS